MRRGADLLQQADLAIREAALPLCISLILDPDSQGWVCCVVARDNTVTVGFLVRHQSLILLAPNYVVGRLPDEAEPGQLLKPAQGILDAQRTQGGRKT